METKRKANGAAPVETDDRSSKRRKVAVSALDAGCRIDAAKCASTNKAFDEPFQPEAR